MFGMQSLYEYSTIQKFTPTQVVMHEDFGLNVDVSNDIAIMRKYSTLTLIVANTCSCE